MKTRLHLTLIGLLLMWMPTFGQETGSFTLDECISYALKHNQNLLNSVLDRQSADARVRQTIADGLPQINGTLDLAYNYQIATTPLPDFISPSVYGVLFQESLLEARDLGEPEIFPAQFGTKYSGSAVISLEQMIFNGSYFVGLKAARTYTELSRKDQIKSQIDVVEMVSKAYYTLLVNQEQLELIHKNYNRLNSLLKDTQGLYEQGFAEKIDVNRIKVQLNNVTVEKDNIDQLINVSRALLKFQMGYPQSEELQIAETIDDIMFEEADIDQEQTFDYQKRIEFSQLMTNEELIELDIKNTNSQYYPEINLYGTLGSSMGAQSSSDMFNFDDNWFGLGVVGVRMNLPIFDGFRKSNIIQQKRIQAEQMINTKEQLKNSIDVEIMQTKISYKRALDNLVAQKENMTLGEEVFNVARIKYEEGVGSSIEVTNADADYKEAQTNYYNSLYDALVAKVELQKAYGTLYN
ncbi:MAG: TolC family protein [Bacteroidota bacterium]